MSVEIKEEAEDAAHALCALVESHGVGDRVLVASFHQAPIDAFRARCPGVATAATRRLFDAGVSGITTARPDHVLALLGRLRGAREAAPVP
jgi:glycerophosphoryl diester phosphodiesterase